MKYFGFLDFEFNQGWSSYEPEIISIGCSIIDENFKDAGKFYAMVRPTINKKIHKHVARVTGINQDELDNSPDFVAVSNQFHEFIKEYKQIQFFSFGTEDWKSVCFTCNVNSCNIMMLDIGNINDFQKNILDSFVCGDMPLWFQQKSINTLCRFYNISPLEAHNSLNDAIMLKDIYVCNKIRGKYDFKNNKFDNMDGISEQDILIANSVAYYERNKEIETIMQRYVSQCKSEEIHCKLTGDIYSHSKYFINKELFASKKKRKYNQYIIKCYFNKYTGFFDFQIKKDNEVVAYFSILSTGKNSKRAHTIIKLINKEIKRQC